MPNYGPVVIATELEKLAAEIKDAKEDGSYATDATTWDQKINKVIEDGCDLAARYVTESNEFTKNLYETTKLAIKQIETIVAKDTVVDKDVGIVDAFKTRIEKAANDADLDSKALTRVLANDYRGGWPATAKKILTNSGVVDTRVGDRNKEINEGKMFAAYRARLKEWEARAAEYLKQVTQRSKQGSVDVAEFLSEIENFLAKMTKANLDVDTLAGKTKSPADRIAGYGKQKTWNATDKKSSKELMASLSATLKSMRGAFKTMTVEFEGFKKRAQSAGPGWKENALKAFKSAKSLYDSTEKIVKEADKRETPCEKVVEKIQKA